MAFDNLTIEKVKESVSIVDIFASRANLVKVSENRYKTCCLFHNEKTPSMNIDGNRGFFYCFGCNASGDVINATMKLDNLSFFDALQKLANIAGIELSLENTDQNRDEFQKKTQMYKILDQSKIFYKKQLNSSSEGKDAIFYLTQKRRLTMESIDLFEIGLATGGASLYNHLKGIGFSDDEIVESGLVKRKHDRCLDFFYERFVVPIMDKNGRTIGFGGRFIGDAKDSNVPKYINTLQSSIFEKGDNLFNFHRAKLSKDLTSQHVLVVEGYMDAIAVANAGYHSVVATLGTAMTEKQLKLLFSIDNEPIICFDSDIAGLKATERIANLTLPMLKSGLVPKFASVEGAKDIDELIQLHNKNPFVAKQVKGDDFANRNQINKMDIDIENVQLKGNVDKNITTTYDKSNKNIINNNNGNIVKIGFSVVMSVIKKAIEIQDYLWNIACKGVEDLSNPNKKSIIDKTCQTLCDSISDKIIANNYRIFFRDKSFQLYRKSSVLSTKVEKTESDKNKNIIVTQAQDKSAVRTFNTNNILTQKYHRKSENEQFTHFSGNMYLGKIANLGAMQKMSDSKMLVSYNDIIFWDLLLLDFLLKNPLLLTLSISIEDSLEADNVYQKQIIEYKDKNIESIEEIEEDLEICNRSLESYYESADETFLLVLGKIASILQEINNDFKQDQNFMWKKIENDAISNALLSRLQNLEDEDVKNLLTKMDALKSQMKSNVYFSTEDMFPDKGNFIRYLFLSKNLSIVVNASRECKSIKEKQFLLSEERRINEEIATLTINDL